MGIWDGVKKALVGSAPAPKSEQKESTPASTPSSNPVHAEPGEGFKACRIEHGLKGWGGPLIIAPNSQRRLVYSVTGGGIHPVAQRIADITGAEPFDGFKSKADFSEIAVAVIDCGGTARVGVYPMKGIPTVDIHAATPSGPLMKYINETNFVSGIKPENVTPVE
jgi:PTS system glucitol/sorbitol-specific IIB component